jgi:hypothetical protein
MSHYKLSPSVTKKLDYYIYLYINPLNGSIFYVGKGKGSRVFDNLKIESENQKLKAKTIREIRAKGKEPQIEILVHGLPDEETAYRIEAAIIDVIGVKNLTNSVRGWRSGHYGRMDVKQLASLYEREKAKIEEPAILIRINQLYRYGMSDIELYDATRGIWRVSKKRIKAKYAFAIYEGIVREVYKIDQWFPAGTTFNTRRPSDLVDPDRWEFVGNLAEGKIRDKYLLKSVEDYFDNSRNPIIYVNCD